MAEETRSYFDGIAESWGRKYQGATGFARRLALVLDEIPPPSGPTPALDVGCGTGELARELTRLGYRPIGIDASAKMLEAAQGLLAARADASRLPFANGAFGLVTAIGVLEYLPDPLVGLSELARVTAPGGVLLATVPNPGSPLRWVERAVYELSRRTGRPARLSYLSYLDHSRALPLARYDEMGFWMNMRAGPRRYFMPTWAERMSPERLPMNVLLRYDAIVKSA